jgi:hypothetical protein
MFKLKKCSNIKIVQNFQTKKLKLKNKTKKDNKNENPKKNRTIEPAKIPERKQK